MICAAFAVIAVGVTLYPLISNLVSETNRSIIETKYTKAVEKMDDTEKIRARTDAQNYNATDGIMGYLEIPVLNLELPIYHGTEESTLDRGLGHLLGSSLPVGGQGTHTVITGHSGLAGKRMFSDLDQIKKGDVFYVKTLDETLAYMVLDINTVLPEDTSRLTIDPNRDSCTLVTCTPYGVNTHRLLVRGERIEYTVAAAAVEDAIIEELPASTWTQEYLRGIGVGLMGIAALTAVIGAVHMHRNVCHQEQSACNARVSVKQAATVKPEKRTERGLFCRSQRKRGKHEI